MILKSLEALGPQHGRIKTIGELKDKVFTRLVWRNRFVIADADVKRNRSKRGDLAFDVIGPLDGPVLRDGKRLAEMFGLVSDIFVKA